MQMEKTKLKEFKEPNRVAVIFDMDGVLCEEFPIEKGQGPWWEKLETLYPMAFPIPQNVFLAQMCTRAGFRVFILTSRQEKVRPITQEWLKQNGIVYAELFMRPNGSPLPAGQLKSQMLDVLLQRGVPGDGAEILFAVDDNPDVANMYASRGINTFRRLIGG